MFKKGAFENILKSKAAAGLEVIIMPDGSYLYQLVILKKKQSTLLTELQRKDLVSLTEVKQYIDPKIPLVIIINGKGIVHRKVKGKENDAPSSLLNKLLPNANADDFVLQKTQVNEEEWLVSVIRLNNLNDFLEQLAANQLTNISACFLGPFVVTNLLPLLDENKIDNEYWQINNFRLKIREQRIVDIETSTVVMEEEIRIGTDSLPYQLLIPFAAALSYFTGDHHDIYNSQALTQLKEEFKQKQKFELRGWTLLIATFLILIINYLFFNNYWSKNKEMNVQLQLSQAALQRYEKLKQDFDQKKRVLEQNGLLENSRTSYYADQLSKELPASVQFTGLNIHPLKKKRPSEEREGFVFENKLIHISGNCRRNTELNEWMKKTKKEKWVADVTLLNYKQDNMEENGVFLIEIKLQ